MPDILFILNFYVLFIILFFYSSSFIDLFSYSIFIYVFFKDSILFMLASIYLLIPAYNSFSEDWFIFLVPVSVIEINNDNNISKAYFLAKFCGIFNCC